jgi:SAM-dependent methyltransferase
VSPGSISTNFSPFKNSVLDAVDLIEVIEHIEHQAQLIREIGRVLTPEGALLISTPNTLNVFSRVRFLFTGFLKARVRPAHYTRKPGQAPNIYLLHFYELYYLLFHHGFRIVRLYQTRIKIASIIFATLLYPFIWLFSLIPSFTRRRIQSRDAITGKSLTLFSVLHYFSPIILSSKRGSIPEI